MNVVPVLTGAAAVLLYCVGALLHWLSLRRHVEGDAPRTGSPQLLGFGAAAAVCHLATVYQVMVQPEGLDLGLFAVASLVGLAVVVTGLVITLRLPLANLLMVIYPIAAIAVLASLWLHTSYVPANLPSPSHVILSLLAYTVLSVAAAQALVLWYQERRLRHTRSLATLSMMPPLQVMENTLFHLLWMGLALLSIAIVTGFLYLDNMFTQRVAQHSVLSLTSWVVFAVLLWGRHTLGWRGATAVRWTLAGFALLALAYFGSKLVIEIILS